MHEQTIRKLDMEGSNCEISESNTSRKSNNEGKGVTLSQGNDDCFYWEEDPNPPTPRKMKS